EIKQPGTVGISVPDCCIDFCFFTVYLTGCSSKRSSLFFYIFLVAKGKTMVEQNDIKEQESSKK
ncbi:hypothetical protein, partial [Gracilibacillus alcaliphilus]|uniref:hypothetical protein n=1 Tax=Gracilibacillus alcaliphilus TaxID=1401441 RepID=UPI001956C031